MVQLGLTENFKQQVPTWNYKVVPMKYSIRLLGQSNISKRDMHKVFMKISEPDSIKILLKYS